jgi:hypothetical protein
MEELLTKEQLTKAVLKQINYTASVVAINNGNGKFTIRALPVMAQMSCIKSIVCTDLNNDGYKDLILGGNEFNFQPQLGRLDANPGQVLLNDGKGNFNLLKDSESGLALKGMVRDIVPVQTKAGLNFLFLQNDAAPVLFKLATAASKNKKPN